jgi:hypothetical protein
MTADLLRDLETAEAGSRELSDRVLLALGWMKDDYAPWLRPDGVYLNPRNGGCNPTEDLNACVALVPEGWAWLVQRVDAPGHASSADLWIPAQRTQGLKKERARADAATPALAFCAALVRAKQSEGTE